MNTDASVFVIDDDPAVRDSLVMVLRGEGIRARAFASGSDFMDHLPDDRLACVITDVRMPGMDGSEVVRRLAALQDREWPMIVITGHADVPTAVQMMKSGIVDFIEKPVDPARLVETVKGVLGRIGKLSLQREQRLTALARLEALTPRERQVFDALVEGLSNKEIARELDISPRTVEIFRARVMDKMAADSLSSLVRMALTLAAD
ncbi:response regulator transcription factor [Brevundimonas viscosa]|uniref:Two component transcriptional regulator, LuxR family n=1 Tax=Brevundimonas viscosa TaxID=871741 RepID=A0A1I6TBK3_9CAUL|nr:response regulator [Brevundimonas viscosa]SFS86503.1 two component transcriptional regulator, LuxR family [Brevundimonas viscosa]